MEAVCSPGREPAGQLSTQTSDHSQSKHRQGQGGGVPPQGSCQDICWETGLLLREGQGGSPGVKNPLSTGLQVPGGGRSLRCSNTSQGTHDHRGLPGGSIGGVV
ncbi:unnamed protein product [Gadus morhua 'NCC']